MSDNATIPLDRFNQLFALVESVSTRLQTLENTIAERLYDTRPLWEQLLPRVEAIENRLDNIEKHLAGMNNRFKVVANQLLDMHGIQEGFDRRLTELEGKVS